MHKALGHNFFRDLQLAIKEDDSDSDEENDEEGHGRRDDNGDDHHGGFAQDEEEMQDVEPLEDHQETEEEGGNLSLSATCSLSDVGLSSEGGDAR